MPYSEKQGGSQPGVTGRSHHPRARQSTEEHLATEPACMSGSTSPGPQGVPCVPLASQCVCQHPEYRLGTSDKLAQRSEPPKNSDHALPPPRSLSLDSTDTEVPTAAARNTSWPPKHPRDGRRLLMAPNPSAKTGSHRPPSGWGSPPYRRVGANGAQGFRRGERGTARWERHYRGGGAGTAALIGPP